MISYLALLERLFASEFSNLESILYFNRSGMAVEFGGTAEAVEHIMPVHA